MIITNNLTKMIRPDRTSPFLAVFVLSLLLSGFLHADDQRSAGVSRDKPNATILPFSDLPYKEKETFVRYLSVGTMDRSFFKKVDSVASDPSSSWFLIDGYSIRTLPYSFPDNNRPNNIHYRGVHDPDSQVKGYRPIFSGTAGDIGGGGGKVKNDYVWKVETLLPHYVCAVFTPSAKGGSFVKDPDNSGVYVYDARGFTIEEALELDNFDVGHASWKLYTELESIPAELKTYHNKWYGLWPGADMNEGQISGSTYYNSKRLFLRMILSQNKADEIFNRLFCVGKFQDPDKKQSMSHDFNIQPDKGINVLNYTNTLKTNIQSGNVIYDILTFNCTDACIGAANAAGITLPDLKISVKIIFANDIVIAPPVKMNSPAALADYLSTL